MDEKGDGSLDRNRDPPLMCDKQENTPATLKTLFLKGPQFDFHVIPRGDPLHARLIAWIEFLLNRGLGLNLFHHPENEDGDDNNNNAENLNNDEIEDNDEDQDDENHGNIDNNESNDNVNNDNNDNILNIDNNENNDNILNIDNNSNHDSLDNNDSINNDSVDETGNRNIDNNNEDAEEAGTSAGVEVGVNQGDEEDPLPGGSRRRSREDDREAIKERSSNTCEWWDEFAECNADSDMDSTDCDENKHAEVPEENPLPGPFRKRTRKTNRLQDERSSKRSRQCQDNSDTVTVTTDQDLAYSRGNDQVSEDADVN